MTINAAIQYESRANRLYRRTAPFAVLIALIVVILAPSLFG